MRIVALEEHFSAPNLAKEIDPELLKARGFFGPRKVVPGRISPIELLAETGQRRLDSMDEAGIAVQVLSNGGPGPELLSGSAGIRFAEQLNNHLQAIIAGHNDRFAGFAALPMKTPDACAKELERCVTDLAMVGAMVHGTTDGRFLDDPFYDSLLAAAEKLDVPIYIHPNVPTLDIRKAYFSNLPDGVDRVLATGGWGWHAEVALHVLRMVMNGIFDKYPALKIIIGHMGEMLPVMLARLDDVSAADCSHLRRKPAQTIIDQVWITTSGIFSQPPLKAALETFGIDRVMFSVDYPFAMNQRGRIFLEEVELPPADMAKLCHGNADALLKLKQ